MIERVTIVASSRTIQAMPWLRFLALLPVSVLLGHEAVFLCQFGWSEDFRVAMTAGGHDGYWLAFSLVVVVLTIGVLVRTLVKALILGHRLTASSAGQDGRRPPV